MKINNVNGISKVNQSSDTQKANDVQHDNTYQGEKVTMETANPAEILGKIMVVQKNESSAENINKKSTQKLDIARSYMDKTRLVVKSAGQELLLKLGLLFQKRNKNETDEHAEIRYLITSSNGCDEYHVANIVNPLNKNLITRILQEKIISLRDLPICFNSSKDTEEVLKVKEDMYDFAKEHFDTKSHGYIGFDVKSGLTSKLLRNTTKQNAQFLKKLMVDNKLHDIHSAVSIYDTVDDVQAKDRMYDFILEDESLDLTNYETKNSILNILHSTKVSNEDFLKKLYKDNIFPKLKIADAISDNSTKEDIQAKSDLYDILSKDPDLNRKLYNNTILTEIIKTTNHFNKPFIEDLYKDGIIDSADIAFAANDIDSDENLNDRYEIYEFLSKDKEVDSKSIAKILYSTNATTKPIIKKYYSDNKLSKEDIPDLVHKFSGININIQSEMYDRVVEHGKFDSKGIKKILEFLKYHTNETIKLINFALKDPNCNMEDIDELIRGYKGYLPESSCKKIKIDATVDKNYLTNVLIFSGTSMGLSRDEVLKKIDDINKIKQNVLKKAEKFVNGRNTEEVNKETIENFFQIYAPQIFDMLVVMDKETIDVMLRKRLSKAKEYLFDLKSLSKDSLEILKKLCSSTNVAGKPFMPTQKLDFIDLLMAYQNNNLSTDKMKLMAEKGNVNLSELQIDLFNQILKNAGLSDEEISRIPKEKLVSWDTKHAHLLAKAINDDGTDYLDIIRAANLQDFESYIDNESNKYGQANAKTKKIFQKMNLDYEKWIHPSKDLEIDFVSADKNKEKLTQIASQLVEDVNTLMQTPINGYIKKQFPTFVNGDKFILPDEFSLSKAKLAEFVKLFTDESKNGMMSAVWKRAKENLTNENPERVKKAQGTLTILDHLKQRENDLKNVSIDKAETSLNWKIKMWDRVPQKDMFQGNYSTCCIGVGSANDGSMPHYLMNRAYNMIEIVDNENGETVGNALCYFVKGADGKPVFVIDNIEINNSKKTSDEAGLKLRESIAEYAAKVAKEVAMNKDIPVYLGTSYNDVPDDDLIPKTKKIAFLGDIDCDSIYMDMFTENAEWTSKKDFTKKCKVLKLK